MRIVLILILMSIAGCSAPNFSIQQPPGISQLITRDISAATTIDQIDYTFAQRQGKLLVTIANSTGKPLTLTNKSSATDAAGRLTFLNSQSINAGASGHVSIPPPPGVDPDLRRPTAAEMPTNQPFEGGVYPDERMIRSIEHQSPKFLWTNGTTVSLAFIYDTGADKPLTHTFVIKRDQ